MTQPHFKRKIQTIKHKHPKRTTLNLTVDYGDIKEITELTSIETPKETVLAKLKEMNPEKISFGFFGQFEVFTYKSCKDNFLISVNGTVYRVPIECWRGLCKLQCRIRGYYGFNLKKKVKNDSKKK